MRKKYFDWEHVFEHIWNNADRDGLWAGDDDDLAQEFHVSETEAHEVVSDLCDRKLIETLFPGRFAITKWRERDGPEEEYAL